MIFEAHIKVGRIDKTNPTSEQHFKSIISDEDERLMMDHNVN